MKLLKFMFRHRNLLTALLFASGVGGFLIFTLLEYRPAPATNASKIVRRSSHEDEKEKPTPPKTTPKPATPSPVATPNPTPAATAEPHVIDCTDCALAAVDKTHSLPSTYTPNVIQTGLAGGGSLTPAAQSQLAKLFAAAKKVNIEASIISSYRSYETQVSTFNYWVSTERAKGLSQAEAEAAANTYSARPGQSEHQLGTTVDLKCAGCADFDAAQNAQLYAFIEKNAHTFGFVVSYPKGQASLTGYTYEPWHIRYIGVQLATELYNTGYTSGNGNYLAKFLRTKGYPS